MRLNKACAVLCENGASGFSTGSVWVISNISTSSKTILNKTPHFARSCCFQLEADRSISWRVILTYLAPSHECCSSFSSVETNKRQFSFWLLLFLKVVGVFFGFFFSFLKKIRLTQQLSQKEEINCVLLKRRVKSRSGWTVPSYTSEPFSSCVWSELVYVGPVCAFSSLNNVPLKWKSQDNTVFFL